MSERTEAIVKVELDGKRCGLRHVAYRPPHDLYGWHFYATSRGEVRFLDPKDPVWDEVEGLVSRALAGDKMQGRFLTEALLAAVVVTIDGAATQEDYRLDETSPCPKCGCTAGRDAPSTAPAWVEAPLVRTAHSDWNALRPDDKAERVWSAISRRSAALSVAVPPVRKWWASK